MKPWLLWTASFISLPIGGLIRLNFPAWLIASPAGSRDAGHGEPCHARAMPHA